MRSIEESSSTPYIDGLVCRLVSAKRDHGEFVSFDFSALGPFDIYQAIDFMRQNTIYFSNYSKTIEKFSGKFYAAFAQALSAFPAEEHEQFKLLTYLLWFLEFQTEEKIRLQFKGLDRLITVLESPSSVRVAHAAAEALAEFFKISLKSAELALFSLGPEHLSRLAAIIAAWRLGADLAVGPNGGFQTIKDSPLFKTAEAAHLEDAPQTSIFRSQRSELSLADASKTLPVGSVYASFCRIRELVAGQGAACWVRSISIHAEQLLKKIWISSLGARVKSIFSLLEINDIPDQIVVSISELSTLLDENRAQKDAVWALLRNIFRQGHLIGIVGPDLVNVRRSVVAMVFGALGIEPEPEAGITLPRLPLEVNQIADVLRGLIEFPDEQDLRRRTFPFIDKFLELIRVLCAKVAAGSPASDRLPAAIFQLLNYTKPFIVKDKDLVFLEVLFEQMRALISAPPIKSHAGLNERYMLAGELLEKANAYFIEPLRSRLEFSVVRGARQVLETGFWSDPILLSLMDNDPEFNSLTSELMIFVNDLFDALPEHQMATMLPNFISGGFFTRILENFGRGAAANEVDSLAFFLALLSKAKLHVQGFVLKPELLGQIVGLVFQREQTLRNLFFFVTRDCFEAVKNLSEQFADFANVHPDLAVPLASALLKCFGRFGAGLSELRGSMVEAADEAAFAARLSQPLILNEFGFFLPGTNQLEENGFLQKCVFSIVFLFTSIFDNHKTDLYKRVLEKAPEILGCGFFEFLVTRMHVPVRFDLVKHIKAQLALFAVISRTNRELVTGGGILVQESEKFGTSVELARGAASPHDIETAGKLLDWRGGEPSVAAVTPQAMKFFEAFLASMVTLEFFRRIGGGRNRHAAIDKALDSLITSLISPAVDLHRAEFLIFTRGIVSSLDVIFTKAVFESNAGVKGKELFSTPFATLVSLSKKSVFTEKPLLRTVISPESNICESGCQVINKVLAQLATTEPTVEATHCIATLVEVCTNSSSSINAIRLRDVDPNPGLNFILSAALPLAKFFLDFVAKQSRNIRRQTRSSERLISLTSAKAVNLIVLEVESSRSMQFAVKQIETLRQKLTTGSAHFVGFENTLLQIAKRASAALIEAKPESFEPLGLLDRASRGDSRGGRDSVSKEDIGTTNSCRADPGIQLKLTALSHKLLESLSSLISELLRCVGSIGLCATKMAEDLVGSGDQKLVAAFRIRRSASVTAALEKELEAGSQATPELKDKLKKLAVFADEASQVLLDLLRHLLSNISKLGPAHSLYLDAARIISSSPELAEMKGRLLTPIGDFLRHSLLVANRSPGRAPEAPSIAALRLYALAFPYHHIRLDAAAFSNLFEGIKTLAKPSVLADLSRALFLAMEKLEFTHENLPIVGDIALGALEFNKSSQVKIFFPSTVAALLGLLTRAVESSEGAAEILFGRDDCVLLKRILRINLICDRVPHSDPVYKNARALFERIFWRKTTVLEALEGDLFGVLHNRSMPVTDFLSDFAPTMTSALTVNALGELIKKNCVKSGTPPVLSLAPNVTAPHLPQHSPFLHNFLTLLFRDLSTKFSNIKKASSDSRTYLFDEVFMSDVLYLQLFPRYPNLFFANKCSTVHRILFDKALGISPKFCLFFKPIFNMPLFTFHYKGENFQVGKSVMMNVLNWVNETLAKAREKIAEDPSQTASLLAQLGSFLWYAFYFENWNCLCKAKNFTEELVKTFETLGAQLLSIDGVLRDRVEPIFHWAQILRAREVLIALNPELSSPGQRRAVSGRHIPATFLIPGVDKREAVISMDSKRYYDMNQLLPTQELRRRKYRANVNIIGIGERAATVEIVEESSESYQESRAAATETDPFESDVEDEDMEIDDEEENEEGSLEENMDENLMFHGPDPGLEMEIERDEEEDPQSEEEEDSHHSSEEESMEREASEENPHSHSDHDEEENSSNRSGSNDENSESEILELHRSDFASGQESEDISDSQSLSMISNPTPLSSSPSHQPSQSSDSVVQEPGPVPATQAPLNGYPFLYPTSNTSPVYVDPVRPSVFASIARRVVAENPAALMNSLATDFGRADAKLWDRTGKHRRHRSVERIQSEVHRMNHAFFGNVARRIERELPRDSGPENRFVASLREQITQMGAPQDFSKKPDPAKVEQEAPDAQAKQMSQMNLSHLSVPRMRSNQPSAPAPREGPRMQTLNPPRAPAPTDGPDSQSAPQPNPVIPAPQPSPAPSQPPQQPLAENQVPVNFDFEAFGLPPNFLEIISIDPEFFNALNQEMQVELIMQYSESLFNPINFRRNFLPPRNPAPPQPPQNEPQVPGDNSSAHSSHQNMIEQQEDNAAFIESLEPELRREVLRTSPQEFLLSLPDYMQREAAELRQAAIYNQYEATHQAVRPGDSLARDEEVYVERHNLETIAHMFDPPKKPVLYPLSPVALDEMVLCQDISPAAVLHTSSAIFDPPTQTKFYSCVLDRLESGTLLPAQKTKTLKFLERLLRANVEFFKEKQNFDRLVKLIPRSEADLSIVLEIVLRAVKAIARVRSRKLVFDLQIDQTAYKCLAAALNTRDKAAISALSEIFRYVSYNEANFSLLVANLQEATDNLAFTLNTKIVDLLAAPAPSKLKPSEAPPKEFDFRKRGFLASETALPPEAAKMIYAFEPGIDKMGDEMLKLNKICTILTDMFERMVAAETLQENKMTQATGLEERRLAAFAAYYDQPNTNALFNNSFKLLALFEPWLEPLAQRKKLASPLFVKLFPLLESFLLVYTLICDDSVLRSAKRGLLAAQKISISALGEPTAEHHQPELSEPSSTQREPGAPIDFAGVKNRLESTFMRGCTSIKGLLNYFLSFIARPQNHPLHIVLKKLPKLFGFDVKRRYFTQKMTSLRDNQHSTELHVERRRLMETAFNSIALKSPLEMRRRLHVVFEGEEGADAGGLTREFFSLISRDIFDPNNALFVPAAHGYAFQPSALSSVNIDHLKYFHFVGRIVGKALLDGHLLDAHFTRSFYKHMIGAPLAIDDLEDSDPEFLKGLQWLLKNDIGDNEIFFSVQTERFGKTEEIELKPGGSTIPVTESNKEEYVRLVVEHRSAGQIREQTESFLRGLSEVVPLDELRIFDAKDIELMISGIPEIDLDDLRENTTYHNYTRDSLPIKLLWQVLQDFDESLRAGFLQFVTGSSKVPLEGFANLKGIGGAVQRFSIHKAYDPEKLPTSHTCMNQLDLPEYPTKEIMADKLKKAILYGSEGFAFT